jgi:hypothetical protein
MSILINDDALASESLAARRARGADRYDEVWEGVYLMAPMTDNERQRIATELGIAFGSVIAIPAESPCLRLTNQTGDAIRDIPIRMDS